MAILKRRLEVAVVGKRASARARKTEPLEDFFENGAVGLHLVASDGTILRANKADADSGR